MSLSAMSMHLENTSRDGNFPRQPVLMLDSCFSAEVFPNIQTKLPSHNLKPFPLVISLGKREQHLPHYSLLKVVSDKVSPEPS